MKNQIYRKYPLPLSEGGDANLWDRLVRGAMYKRADEKTARYAAAYLCPPRLLVCLFLLFLTVCFSAGIDHTLPVGRCHVLEMWGLPTARKEKERRNEERH